MNKTPFLKPSFIAGYVCAAIVTIGCYWWFIRRANMPYEEIMREEVSNINSKLPMQVDAFTIMDSVAYIESQPEEAAYFYRIQGELDNPEIWTPSLISSFQYHTLEALKQEKSTEMMRKRGFLFSYHYYSESQPQQLLCEFVIGPDDYSDDKQ